MLKEKKSSLIYKNAAQFGHSLDQNDKWTINSNQNGQKHIHINTDGSICLCLQIKMNEATKFCCRVAEILSNLKSSCSSFWNAVRRRSS